MRPGARRRPARHGQWPCGRSQARSSVIPLPADRCPGYAKPGVACHPGDLATIFILPGPRPPTTGHTAHQQGQTAHRQTELARAINRRKTTHQWQLSHHGMSINHQAKPKCDTTLRTPLCAPADLLVHPGAKGVAQTGGFCAQARRWTRWPRLYQPSCATALFKYRAAPGTRRVMLNRAWPFRPGPEGAGKDGVV
jgi:hypothetical protein